MRAVPLLWLLSLAALPAAAGAVEQMEVHGRTYVVVGECREPAHSIRLTLAPPPGQGQQHGLSVLFGADRAGRGYRFDADAEGWALRSATAGGERLLAGQDAPFLPTARPVNLLIKRRDLLVTVAVNGRALAEVADADHFAGLVAVDPSLSAPGGEPALQNIGRLYFEDGFMRPEDDLSLATWSIARGRWELHSIREDVDDMDLARHPEQKRPQIDRSANPFSISAEADDWGLLTTGYWFWHDLEAAVSVRDLGVGATGLAFNVASEEDFFLLRWQNDARVLGPTRIELLRVRAGRREPLATAWVNGQTGQWYRLGVRTCGQRIQAVLDEAVIIDLHHPESLGGRIGLYVEAGEQDAQAFFDDALVRAIPGYGFDDEVWLGRHAAQGAGRWELARVERPARPDGVGARLRTRSGRLVLGHDGWGRSLVSAAVTPPAEGQSIGFVVGPADAGYRVTLSRTAEGPRLAVARPDGGRELAACADFELPDGETVELRADLTRPGELNVHLEGRLRLHLAAADAVGGPVTLFAEAFAGAEFRHVRVDFERREDTERLPAEEIFVEDPYMRHWSSPQGAWWPEQGRRNTWSHVGDFYGRSEIELPFKPGLVLVHAAEDASAESGYALSQAEADEAAGGVRLTLSRAGAQAAAADVEPPSGDDARLVVCREGPYVWVTVGGEEVIAFRDPDPLPGTKVALSGLDAEGLAAVKVHRNQVRDYYFERAPADWFQAGQWKVTTRFACDPRWTFMTALATQGAVLYSKYRYAGDVTLEAYMGMRMPIGRRAGRYRRVGDLNLALCRDPLDLGSGYGFVIAGWDRHWSDLSTYLLRGTETLALSSEQLLPNVRREDTSQRVLPVPWISGGRDIHGAWYYVKARKLGDELSSYVDNHPAYACRDPEPLGEFTPAVWTYSADIVVARMKISYQDVSVPGRLVDPPEREAPPPEPDFPAPVIVSASHPGFSDDFEGGQRGWSTYDGQQSGLPRITAATAADGRCSLQVTNPAGGGLFEAMAPVDEARIRAADVASLRFDYRIPPDVHVNFFVKADGQYYYVHMTGPDEPSAFYRRLGAIEIIADGQWHAAEFPLGDAYRDAAGSATGVIEYALFGNLHRGPLQAGIGGNRLGAAYHIDNFQMVPLGPPQFGPPTVAGRLRPGQQLLTAVDRHAATLPGAQKATETQSLPAGQWFCHARVRNADGETSGVAHLPLLVAEGPLQIAAAEPAEGGSWGYGPIELDLGAPTAPRLDPDSLRLSVNGRAVERYRGLFEVDWTNRRLRIDLARAGLPIADGERCRLELSYADRFGRAGSFGAEYVASTAADRTPPGAVRLAGFLPPEDFESDMGGWEARGDVALLRDETTAASGRYSLMVQNLQWASAFMVFARKEGLDAAAYPLLEFDYKAPPGVQFDLVALNPRGYASVGLSDRTDYGFHLGDVEDFIADDTWRHAVVDLLHGLRRVPYRRGVFQQRWIALGDFGYRANATGAYYHMDNFRFVPLVSGRDGLELRWSCHDAGGIQGYSYLWSDDADATPDDRIDAAEAMGVFADLPVPDAYFHVRACDAAGNWGPVSRFRFRVDPAPPDVAGVSPVDGERTASSVIAARVDDAGSAVDPESFVLKVNGRPYDLNSAALSWDAEDSKLSWNWLAGRLDDEYSVPNGREVAVELAAADVAGNALPTRRWAWVMDYSKDVEPPTPPAVSADGLAIHSVQDFEDGLGQWQNRRGQMGAQMKLVPRAGDGSGRCLQMFAATENALLEAVAFSERYNLEEHPALNFDYRMEKGLKVNLQVQINSTWLELTLTAPNGRYKAIGKADDIRADDAWHHASINLLALARDALPNARRYNVSMITFGDLARTGNRKNAHWYVDNFMVSGYGDPKASFNWRSLDVTGVEGYAVAFDRQMETDLPRQVTTAEQSAAFEVAEPGTWWLHVAAYDGNGNWSETRRLAYPVAEPVEPEAGAEPATDPEP